MIRLADISEHEGHEGEYAQPETCAMCRRTLEGFLRFGVTYEAKRDCAICQRRPEDMTVNLDGRIVGICETCWERAEDERHG